MLETVEQGEGGAMGQQTGAKFGTFSSCWKKKHHDGVGRRDVSHQKAERAASEG